MTAASVARDSGGQDVQRRHHDGQQQDQRDAGLHRETAAQDARHGQIQADPRQRHAQEQTHPAPESQRPELLAIEFGGPLGGHLLRLPDLYRVRPVVGFRLLHLPLGGLGGDQPDEGGQEALSGADRLPAFGPAAAEQAPPPGLVLLLGGRIGGALRLRRQVLRGEAGLILFFVFVLFRLLDRKLQIQGDDAVGGDGGPGTGRLVRLGLVRLRLVWLRLVRCRRLAGRFLCLAGLRPVRCLGQIGHVEGQLRHLGPPGGLRRFGQRDIQLRVLPPLTQGLSQSLHDDLPGALGDGLRRAQRGLRLSGSVGGSAGSFPADRHAGALPIAVQNGFQGVFPEIRQQVVQITITHGAV